MSELNALEIERAVIFKRLKILKFLAFLEGFIALFLAFVASKDLIIALVVSVFAGVFFYRFLSRKLLARQKDIESTLLRHFLTQNEAEFKGDLGAILQKLVLPFADFKASNTFEFKVFFLCDISFKNASGQAFIGILLVLKEDNLNSAKAQKFKANLSSIDENALFQRLTNADFSTDRLLIKDNFALIATLKNPFFIEKKLNLKQNLEKINANLAKIQALIAQN